MNRIWPLAICASRKKVSRQAAGATNGRRPSITSISAKAVSSLEAIRSVLLAPAGVLHELEEFGTRIDDQHVVLVREAFAIGLEATVEGIELGVLAVSLRVDVRR